MKVWYIIHEDYTAVYLNGFLFDTFHYDSPPFFGILKELLLKGEVITEIRDFWIDDLEDFSKLGDDGFPMEFQDAADVYGWGLD